VTYLSCIIHKDLGCHNLWTVDAKWASMEICNFCRDSVK